MITAERTKGEEEPLVGAFLRKHRRGWERAVVAIFTSGAVLMIGGVAVTLIDWSGTGHYGIWVASLGVLTLAAGVEMAHPIQTLRTLGVRSRGGDQYARLRNWTRLKTASILLNLLTILTAAVLVGAILRRAGLLHFELDFTAAFRLSGVLNLALAITLVYAFWLSLQTPIHRPKTGVEGAIFRIAMVGSLALAGLSSVLAYAHFKGIAVLAGLRTADTPYLLLASFAVMSFVVYRSRALPTVYALFTEEREFYKGRTYYSAKKSLVMPTMAAFALLLLVLLALIVFQLGVVGLVEEIPRNFVLLGVFAFIVISLIASVIFSVTLSRSEDHMPLYKQRRSAEAKRAITILSVSAAFATVFLALSATLFLGYGIPRVPMGHYRWIDLFCIGLLVAIGPYGFYFAHREKRIRNLEERFPDFLRDLASSRRAGLTLHSAVQIAARGEYGALTPEIQKMADQLSWNVPFDEALRRFGDRVKTPLVQRAVTLINEASRSGGNVAEVFLAAAMDAREIKNLENERRTTMVMYSIVTYITFFVFLVVVAILYGTFIPEIIRASEAAVAGGFGGVGGVGLATAVGLRDYRVFFFMAALVQGLGNGMIAGLMESGKTLSGLRHAFVMALITFLTFSFVLIA